MENIKDILLSRGCPANQVKTISKKIEELSDQLKPAMHEWLEKEAMPVVEIDGYTTASLMKQFKGMQYPATLFLLDWIIKDPQNAKKIINKGIK